MKLFLIGATGFVGTKVLDEALLKGHHVTALVRNPEKVIVKNDLLMLIKGDVFDEGALSKQFKGHDAIISAYNSGWKNPNLYEDFKKGYHIILDAAKQSDIKRILVVGGAASLEVKPGVRVYDTPVIPKEFRPMVMGAMELLDEIKKEHELDWTFLSPPSKLFSGERTGIFRLGKDNPVVDEKGENTISTGDLAVAIINEIEHPQFICQRFTVGY